MVGNDNSLFWTNRLAEARGRIRGLDTSHALLQYQHQLDKVEELLRRSIGLVEKRRLQSSHRLLDQRRQRLQNPDRRFDDDPLYTADIAQLQELEDYCINNPDMASVDLVLLHGRLQARHRAVQRVVRQR